MYGSTPPARLLGYSLRTYDVTFVVRANWKWRRHSYQNLTSGPEQSHYLIMSTQPRMEYVNESLVYRLPHGSNIDSDRVRLIL